MIVALAIGLIVAGAALLLLVPSDEPAPQRAAEPTATPTDTPGPAAEPPKPTTEPSTETEGFPVSSRAAATTSGGNGRIYGTATLPADAPTGLQISVAVHRVPN